MNHVINKGSSKALTNNFFKKMKTGAYSKRLTLSPLGFNPVLRNPCLILLGRSFLIFCRLRFINNFIVKNNLGTRKITRCLNISRSIYF